MVARLANLRSRGVAARLIVLGSVVLAACALAAPVALRLGGSLGLAAAAIAAGLCLLGAAAALAVTDRLRASGKILATLWLSAALRIGVPFGVGMAIHLHGGPLAQAGLLWYLVGFYLIVLATGTILSLPPTSRQCHSGNTEGDGGGCRQRALPEGKNFPDNRLRPPCPRRRSPAP
jgi:hypothetical protein